MLIPSAKRWLAILGFALGTQAAWAWGEDAHRLVAEAAEMQLVPRAAAEVRRLLSAEPGASMGSVASWADEVRSREDAPWHYVNLPPRSGCQYNAPRDCPDGACVVGAIERQLQILGSGAADEQRLKALKYVIHFIGDIHQPLHAGYAEDKGGNTIQLQAFDKGTNLHALWDSGLVQNWPEGVGALRASVLGPATQAAPATMAARASAVPAPASAGPAQWAEESCRLVEQPWFYPGQTVLDEAYAHRAQPIVQQRITMAAARLAAALNGVLGGH